MIDIRGSENSKCEDFWDVTPYSLIEVCWHFSKAVLDNMVSFHRM
jgi:hypothetical protein